MTAINWSHTTAYVTSRDGDRMPYRRETGTYADLNLTFTIEPARGAGLLLTVRKDKYGIVHTDTVRTVPVAKAEAERWVAEYVREHTSTAQ